MISDILLRAITNIEWWQKRFAPSDVYNDPEIKPKIDRVKEAMRQLADKLMVPPEGTSPGIEFLSIWESDSYRETAADDLAIMDDWLKDDLTRSQRVEILKSQELLRPILQKEALTYEDCQVMDSVYEGLVAVGLDLHYEGQVIEVQAIWDVIATTDQASVETRAILYYVFDLAHRISPLELPQYRAFWAQGWQEGGAALNTIVPAVDRLLDGPLFPSARRFLLHLRQCSRYLGTPGHERLEEDRGRWMSAGREVWREQA
jgi:hypothetical protein